MVGESTEALGVGARLRVRYLAMIGGVVDINFTMRVNSTMVVISVCSCCVRHLVSPKSKILPARPARLH